MTSLLNEARDLFDSRHALAVRQITNCDVASLAEIEHRAIAAAVPKRQNEFFYGRAAARDALRQLGVEHAVIPKSSDRSPQWPPGFVGSIAHSGDAAIAVVGRKGDCRGVGVDLEGNEALAEEMWPDILVQSELEWLSTQPAPTRCRWAKVIFCAKESFYKMQYPLTSTLLNFTDVKVVIHSSECRFMVSIPSSLRAALRCGDSCYGNYRIMKNHTIAGAAL